MGQSQQASLTPVMSESEKNTPQVSKSKAEQQNRMWNTMRWFDGTAKAEADFYIRFQNLPEDDVTFLKSFYHIGDDRELFKMICKFWDIRSSNKTPIA